MQAIDIPLSDRYVPLGAQSYGYLRSVSVGNPSDYCEFRIPFTDCAHNGEMKGGAAPLASALQRL